MSDVNSQQDQQFKLQIVESTEGISEFAEAWDDLFARAVEAPPFLSRPWISTFLFERKKRNTPLFILVWSGTKLVALLPLEVRRYLNVKIAKPISTARGFYLGLLLDPNYRPVIEYMVDAVKSGKIFDVYYSADLSSGDTATNDLLDEMVRKGFYRRHVFRNPCFYIKLDCSFDEYFKKKASSKSRQNLRRRERHLFRDNDVKVEHYAGGEVTPDILVRIATVEQRSWLKRRGAAVLHEPFYQKLLLKMAQAGFGHVWLMAINGDDAAFEYVFVTHKRLQFGWRAFNLKYASSLSVGQILMMHAIRHACDSGILSMDIGHGESDYKKFWAKDNYRVDRVVAGRGFTGHLIATSFYVVWLLGETKWIHSFYHRVKKILCRLRRKASDS